MAKLSDTAYGKLIETVNKRTGQPYRDWRRMFMDRPGIILIYESERKRPGRFFINFYPKVEDPILLTEQIIACEPPRLRTSIGDVEKNDTVIQIETEESRYVFEISDVSLAEYDKGKLELL